MSQGGLPGMGDIEDFLRRGQERRVDGFLTGMQNASCQQGRTDAEKACASERSRYQGAIKGAFDTLLSAAGTIEGSGFTMRASEGDKDRAMQSAMCILAGSVS